MQLLCRKVNRTPPKRTILRAVDRQQDVFLVLLDLSAAFDTIDNGILLHRLHSRFGFSGSVLKWFRTYQHGRSQWRVTIGDCTSDSSTLECGVPQGSVLGPLLFTLYIAPLEDLVRAHSLMFYADDSQVYIIMNPADVPVSLSNLRKCLYDITAWNTSNMLTRNPGKTEVIHFSSRFLNNTPIHQFSFSNISIELSDKVCDLGVVLDRDLDLRSQQHLSKCLTHYQEHWPCAQVSFPSGHRKTHARIHNLQARLLQQFAVWSACTWSW